jgi:hypothetical protein
MNDYSDLKSGGEKARNARRTKKKAEKNNGDPKLIARHIKKKKMTHI